MIITSFKLFLLQCSHYHSENQNDLPVSVSLIILEQFAKEER